MTFSKFITSGKKIITFEFFPPKKEEDLPATYALMAELSKLEPDFMTVTYGAGGGTRAFTEQMVSYAHNELGMTAVAHLACSGHSKSEIAEMLERLQNAGISHILALRGDPPNGEPFMARPDGFRYASELVSFIKQHGDFSVAVAGYPEKHPEAESFERDLYYLKQKVDAGAELIITQLFFDTALYFNFVKKAREIGITVPILPGIMPINSVAQIKRITARCKATIPDTLLSQLNALPESEVQNFGTEYALKMCRELLAGGSCGVHIFTLNKSTHALKIVKALRNC